MSRIISSSVSYSRQTLRLWAGCFYVVLSLSCESFGATGEDKNWQKKLEISPAYHFRSKTDSDEYVASNNDPAPSFKRQPGKKPPFIDLLQHSSSHDKQPTTEQLLVKLGRSIAKMPESGLCMADSVSVQTPELGFQAAGRVLLSKYVAVFLEGMQQQQEFKFFDQYTKKNSQCHDGLEEKIKLYKQLGNPKATVHDLDEVDLALIARALKKRIIVYCEERVRVTEPVFLVFNGAPIHSEKELENQPIASVTVSDFLGNDWLASIAADEIMLIASKPDGRNHFNALLPNKSKVKTENYYLLESQLTAEKIAFTPKDFSESLESREKNYQDVQELYGLDEFHAMMQLIEEMRHDRRWSSAITPVINVASEKINKTPRSDARKRAKSRRKEKQEKEQNEQIIKEEQQSKEEQARIKREAKSAALRYGEREKIALAPQEIASESVNLALERESILLVDGSNPEKGDADKGNGKGKEKGKKEKRKKVKEVAMEASDVVSPIGKDCEDREESGGGESVETPNKISLEVPAKVEVTSSPVTDSHLRDLAESVQSMTLTDPLSVVGSEDMASSNKDQKDTVTLVEEGDSDEELKYEELGGSKNPKKKRRKRNKKNTNKGNAVVDDSPAHQPQDDKTEKRVDERELSLEEQLQSMVDKATEKFKRSAASKEVSLFIFYLSDIFHLKNTAFWQKHLSVKFVRNLDSLVNRVRTRFLGDPDASILVWLQMELRVTLTGKLTLSGGARLIQSGCRVVGQCYKDNALFIENNREFAFKGMKEGAEAKNNDELLSVDPILEYMGINKEWRELFEGVRSSVVKSGSFSESYSKWLPLYALYSLRVRNNVDLSPPDGTEILRLSYSPPRREDLTKEMINDTKSISVHYNGSGISIPIPIPNSAEVELSASLMDSVSQIESVYKKKKKKTAETVTTASIHKPLVNPVEQNSAIDGGAPEPALTNINTPSPDYVTPPARLAPTGRISTEEQELTIQEVRQDLEEQTVSTQEAYREFTQAVEENPILQAMAKRLGINSLIEITERSLENIPQELLKKLKASSEAEVGGLYKDLQKLMIEEGEKLLEHDQNVLAETLKTLGVDKESAPRAISPKKLTKDVIQLAITFLGGCQKDSRCRFLMASLSFVQLLKYGGLSKHRDQWTVRVIAPLMVLADEYYPAAKMLARILTDSNFVGARRIYLHYPYLVKLFDSWKGRTSKPVFYIAVEEILQNDCHMCRMLDDFVSGNSLPDDKAFNNNINELLKLVFHVAASGKEEFSQWLAALNKSVIEVSTNHNVGKLWGWLCLLLQKYQAPESLVGFEQLFKEQALNIATFPEGRDGVLQGKFPVKSDGKDHVIELVLGLYDPDFALLLAPSALDKGWLQILETGLKRAFYLNSLDSDKQDQVLPVLMSRTWALYRQPKRLREIADSYDSQDKGGIFTSPHLRYLANKWESDRINQEVEFSADESKQGASSQQVPVHKLLSGADLVEETGLKAIEAVKSLEQVTGRAPNKGELVKQKTRVARYLVPERRAVADQYLWKALKQMNPQIVTYFPTNRRALRLHWNISQESDIHPGVALVKDLESASQWGSGLADIVLALAHTAGEQTERFDRHFSASIGRKIVYFLRRAAMKGQVQALGVLVQTMINDHGWADATGLYSLAENCFSSDSAPVTMHVELASEATGENLPPFIFSTSADSCESAESMELASTLSELGREKSLTKRCEIIMPLVRNALKRATGQLPDEALRDWYAVQAIFLGSLARQVPECSLGEVSGQLEALSNKYPVMTVFNAPEVKVDTDIIKLKSSCHGCQTLEVKATGSLNDTAQIVELMLRAKDNWPAFHKLWKKWFEQNENYYMSSRREEGINEEFFEIISGIGPLFGLSSVVMAVRLHEYQRDIVREHIFSQAELDYWIKHLLRRGVELESADAARYWFEWFGPEDEPEMIGLAVELYIAKFKKLPKISPGNGAALLKLANLAGKIGAGELYDKTRKLFLDLDLSALSVKHKKIIERAVGFDVFVPDIARQVIEFVDPDRGLHPVDALEKVVWSTFLLSKTSPAEVAACLDKLRNFYPGQLERDSAEITMGMTLVSLVMAIPEVLEEDDEGLVISPGSLINLLLDKATALGNDNASLVKAGLNTDKSAFEQVPITHLDSKWLGDVLVPLALSAETQPFARDRLAEIMLAYPDMRHFPTLVSLYRSDYEKGKNALQINFEKLLLPGKHEELLKVKHTLEKTTKLPIKDPGSGESEYEQMIVAQKCIEGEQGDYWLRRSQMSEEIISRNLTNSLYKKEWEYLKSEALTRLAKRKAERGESVDTGGVSEEMKTLISQGNSNYNLGLLSFIEKTPLDGRDLHEMERIAISAFSMDDSNPDDLGILPVQLLCLSSTFFLDENRLFLLAESYMAESGKGSSTVVAEEEKFLYLFNRAAKWGSRGAYLKLCNYWKERDQRVYKEYVWRYLRVVYNIALQDDSIFLVNWGKKMQQLLLDPVYNEAYQYFFQKLNIDKK